MFVKSIVGEGSLIQKNIKRKEEVKKIIENDTYESLINDLFIEHDYKKFKEMLNKLFFEDVYEYDSGVLFKSIQGLIISKDEFTSAFYKRGIKGAFESMVYLGLL